MNRRRLNITWRWKLHLMSPPERASLSLSLCRRGFSRHMDHCFSHRCSFSSAPSEGGRWWGGLPWLIDSVILFRPSQTHLPLCRPHGGTQQDVAGPTAATTFPCGFYNLGRLSHNFCCWWQEMEALDRKAEAQRRTRWRERTEASGLIDSCCLFFLFLTASALFLLRPR